MELVHLICNYVSVRVAGRGGGGGGGGGGEDGKRKGLNSSHAA